MNTNNNYKMNQNYINNHLEAFINANKSEIFKSLKIKYIDLEVLLKILNNLSKNEFKHFYFCINNDKEVDKRFFDINKIVIRIQEKLKRGKKELKIDYQKLIEDLDKEIIELVKNKFFVNNYCRYEFIKLHNINIKLDKLTKFIKSNLKFMETNQFLINKIYTNLSIIESNVYKIKCLYKNNIINKNLKNELTLTVARKEVEHYRYQLGYHMDRNEYWNIIHENLRKERQFEEIKFKEHIKDDPYYEEAKSRFEKLKNTLNNNIKVIKEEVKEEYISEDSEYEYYEESSDDEV
jgi:hypothetical protein